MATHFLLTAAARTLSLKAIYKRGEEKAFELFCQLRWPETDGAPVCPRCGCCESYNIKTRRKFKCKACHHQFSPTSGTILASRKLGYVDIVAAICIVVNGAKGISALQLTRNIDVQHKTAWVLVHKLREAMEAETENATVDGVAEVDGAHFGGHIRPTNLAKDRVDRRKSEHQTGKRRVVVAIRQRKGRTLPFVVRNEADGVAIVKRVVKPNTVIHADEASHWDSLHAQYNARRINHKEGYSIDDCCTNQAESFFARLRNMIQGQHHGVNPKYLHAYASHAAWMEDHRRENNGALTCRVIGLALHHPVSRDWKGYWQRAQAA